MKTEILKQVSGLGLERTFLNLRLAQRTVIDPKYERENDHCQNCPAEEEKWTGASIESSDSGTGSIVKPQYGSDCISKALLLPSLNETCVPLLKP